LIDTANQGLEGFVMPIVYAAIALVVGLLAGYYIRKVQITNQVNSIEAKVARSLEDAKTKEKEILLEAKAKALEIGEQAKKTEQELRSQILKTEERLSRKESDLERKFNEVDQAKQEVAKKKEEALKTHDELKEIKLRQLEQLQKISNLTTEDAKRVLMESTEKSMREELAQLTRKLIANAREDADKKAKEIVSLAIQRCASEVTSETTTTAVSLPSEEMKGRIIGKEGRNIRTFEQMLGVEVIVDDTPDAVVISGFNSVRRHIAKGGRSRGLRARYH
jgi:ribonucrease Y